MTKNLSIVLVFLAACGGGGGGGGGDDGGGDDTGSDELFPAGSFYDDDVTGLAPVANSDAITAYMEATHGPNGWGTGEMRIDFSIIVNRAPAGAGKQAFEIVPDYCPPECDRVDAAPRRRRGRGDWQNPPTWQPRRLRLHDLRRQR
jgi:hypothetical protein